MTPQLVEAPRRATRASQAGRPRLSTAQRAVEQTVAVSGHMDPLQLRCKYAERLATAWAKLRTQENLRRR